MPNDMHWSCKNCKYYAGGYCFKHESMMKEWDLCPDWEDE